MEHGIILCVDDDSTILVALRTLLSHALGSAYHIEVAESGEEALEILDDIKKAGQSLSIVISDFIMPGMHGDELLIQVHQRSPRTITIMLTGQSNFDGVKNAINQANLYRFLEKPFNQDDIVLTAKSAFLAFEHEQMLTTQNGQLRTLNRNLEEALKVVQESERFLEDRVFQRTGELDEKNKALQNALRTLEDVERIARHDLKTPLVSIAAAPGLLRGGRSLDEHEEEILCMIESAANRALSMVNLSLDLFRMESGSYVFRPCVVDLTAVVASVAMGLAAHARSKSVDLLVAPVSNRVYVEADDSLCYSIIGNLTKNAIEAAPDHTQVRLTIIEGKTVNLHVHNHGAVPPDLRANFFGKYTTSGKEGGTGLGTYSSHLLARVQGGALTMQTSDEKGTTLCLSLKRATVPSILSEEDKAQTATRGAQTASKVLADSALNRRILLVDDDDFNQMVMSEYIPQPRFTLATAINGRMAVESVIAQRPDIIIMDLEMPIMGGAEALKKIRQHQASNAQPPSFIVAYSGNDDHHSRATYLADGFDECLGKPSSREEVLSLLNGIGR